MASPSSTDQAMHRYQEVAKLIQEWIGLGLIKPGNRVPSVREMSRQTGFSMVTVHHAYSLLESEGVIEARPRSGFYVSHTERALGNFPEMQDELQIGRNASPTQAPSIYELNRAWRQSTFTNFASLHLSNDLIPTRQLNAQLLRTIREEIRQPNLPEPVEGHSELREIVAKRLSLRGVAARSADIILTSSTPKAIELALDTVTKPGDAVLIESPSYYPLFAGLRRRQLQPVEIYSHPRFGVDPAQFEYLLEHNKIAACVLMPINHFPTGTTYSDNVLRNLVASATGHGTRIIEIDLYAELSHTPQTASSLKKYDVADIVTQVGSFSAGLGPRFGVAWIHDRSHRREILEMLYSEDAEPGNVAIQRAVGNYINLGVYDRHVRRIREELGKRVRRGLSQILQTFPTTCSISHPTGGFMCWVRCHTGFDSLKGARKAAEYRIGISPGSLFSVTGSFPNFLGLNLSTQADSHREHMLQTVAELIRE
ncbi:MAG: PLP-dependent aminotransferase family protein [Mesorhizobium sp.]|uniref:aminotransferase-like domain-containing protein n=1 Tax=Mesorhizobium sp. TaxID=1871066 RepID=UPI000FE9CA25|nr:PLP-dependent aminotransferase family protein [Mesorhizobium sp.]RWE21530.1 MAG: PLP-dependent aminotransferase family protein [Mesorhizobium sp.]